MSKSLKTLNFLISNTSIQISFIGLQAIDRNEGLFHIPGKPYLMDGNKNGF